MVEVESFADVIILGFFQTLFHFIYDNQWSVRHDKIFLNILFAIYISVLKGHFYLRYAGFRTINT